MRRARSIAGAVALTGLGLLLFGVPAVLGSVAALLVLAAVGLGGAAYAALELACRRSAP